MPSNLPSQHHAIARAPSPQGGRASAIAPPVGASPLVRRALSGSFLLLLALITGLPLIALPAAQALSLWDALPRGIGPATLLVVLITGPIHVASTLFFYFDPAFRPVLRESPLRCLWSVALVPLTLATLGTLAVIFVGDWSYLVVYTFHNSWLFYHYQRQNFGLASFISKHTGGGLLPARVNTALNVAAIGGALCLLGSPDFYQLADLSDPARQLGGLVGDDPVGWLRLAGTLVYALSFALMGLALFASGAPSRPNLWVNCSLLVGLLFFLPTVLSASMVIGLLPLAVAHGAQYLLMMSVVSTRSRLAWWGLGLLAALSVGVGVCLDRMTTELGVLALIGVGVVQVHFLVDSKVWRLREARQRAIMSDRFDFLLQS